MLSKKLANLTYSRKRCYDTRCKVLYSLCKVLKKRVDNKTRKIVREAEKMIESKCDDLKFIKYIENTDRLEVNVNVLNYIINHIQDSEIKPVLYNLVCIIRYHLTGLPTLTSDIKIWEMKKFLILIDYSYLEYQEELVSRLMMLILQGKAKECKKILNKVIKNFKEKD